MGSTADPLNLRYPCEMSDVLQRIMPLLGVEVEAGTLVDFEESRDNIGSFVTKLLFINEGRIKLSDKPMISCPFLVILCS